MSASTVRRVVLSIPSGFASWVAPLPCVGCGATTGAGCGAGLCAPCAEGLVPAHEAPPPPGVDAWCAAHSYEGVWRSAAVAGKSRRTRFLLTTLVEHLSVSLRDAAVENLAGQQLRADVVTWPPTTRSRRRRRGFDQAEVLARGVARSLSHPAAQLLTRDRGAPAQEGRSRSARQGGPRFRATRQLHGLCVLVVDDVATTGATLAASAEALRAAGARRVVAAAAARTPLPRSPSTPDGRNTTESEKSLQICHGTSDSGG